MAASIPSYWKESKAFLRSADPIMANIIDTYEDPPLRSMNRPFETLVHAIVGQQISAKAADAVWKRLLALVGEVTPELLRQHRFEELRSVGLSRRKTEYILGLAEQGAWIVDHDWTLLSDDAVRESLCDLRGVGPWTAEMVLIFSFLRPDILPLGDIGVVRAIESLYNDGAPLERGRIVEISDVWKPFRTVATWYLWRFLDAEPVEY